MKSTIQTASIFLGFLFVLVACGPIENRVTSLKGHENQVANGEGLLGKNFETEVLYAMKKTQTPGLAVGVIRDGKLVYAKGFGYRNAEQKLPVTPNTLFRIGSTTKAMTATLIGTLVDEGKLTWDTKVKDVYPAFNMMDKEAQEKATLTDLLSHQTGLPRHDFSYWGRGLKRKQILAKLQHLESNTKFRKKWQYNNIMYSVAGHVAGRVEGTTWEELMEKRIFKPLQMSSANTSIQAMQKSPNHAFPYLKSGNSYRRIKFVDLSGIGPAGSVNASLVDLSKWVKLQLKDGVSEGQRLVRSSTLKKIHSPLIKMGAKGPSYGLGWIIAKSNGRKYITHGGGVDGFTTDIIFVPEENTGVITIANSSGSLMPTFTRNEILNRLLKLKQENHLQKVAKLKLPELTPPKILPLDKNIVTFMGTFSHPGYGKIKISKGDAETLLVTVGMYEFKMGFTGNNTFSMVDVDKGHVVPPLMFKIKDGKVESIGWQLEPLLKKPIRFLPIKPQNQANG